MVGPKDLARGRVLSCEATTIVSWLLMSGGSSVSNEWIDLPRLRAVEDTTTKISKNVLRTCQQKRRFERRLWDNPALHHPLKKTYPSQSDTLSSDKMRTSDRIGNVNRGLNRRNEKEKGRDELVAHLGLKGRVGGRREGWWS